MIEVQVRIADDLILAYGTFPDGSPDPSTVVIAGVEDDQLPRLESAGDKFLEEDGTVRVESPPPPPIAFDLAIRVRAQVRTTDEVAVEVFRFPCETLSLYRASLVIHGIDAGTFVSKIMEGRFTWKRTTANAVMVGITVVSDIHDAAAASWAPSAVPSGTDVVFAVKGAAGRTIDWLLQGDVSVFAPGGIEE